MANIRNHNAQCHLRQLPQNNVNKYFKPNMLLRSKNISKCINLFVLNFISIIHDFLQPMVNNMIPISLVRQICFIKESMIIKVRECYIYDLNQR